VALPQKISESVTFQLQGSPRNCVANHLVINRGSGHGLGVKGFLGVPKSKAPELWGAFCWKEKDGLHGISFEVDTPLTNPSITTLELVPPNIRQTEVFQLVTSFILKMAPKIDKQYLDHLARKKRTGGRDAGRGLSAHQRHRTRPQDRFDEVLAKEFTQTFIDLARKLHITYK
jgi:hypothetical protein